MRRRTAWRVVATMGAAVLALAGCGSDPGSGGVSDGEILHLALNQTEQHPSYIALESFGERLAEATGGRWELDVFPNETLGAQQEALQLVSDGIIDMAVVSGTQLENLNPDFVVFNLPRVFDSVEHQMTVINDEAIVGDLYSSLEERNSFTVLGGFTQGTRSLYTTFGPVTTPEDLSGRKIRVQESQLHIAMVEAMGGSATPMAFGEVYTALQSGVLDGAENNEVSYVTQKHFEVAPYWSATNHLVGLDYMIVNSETLERMPPDVRAALEEEWAAATEEFTRLWGQATEDAIASAKAGGAQFSEVDTEAFDAVLEPLADEFATTQVQRQLYEAARAAAGQGNRL